MKRLSRDRIVLLALAMLVGALPLHGQRKEKEPKRPKLEATADTNDAEAYLTWGLSRDVPWNKAIDAFYWAQRLDPTDPSHRYAHYLALWYRQPPQWRGEHFAGAEYVVNSKEAKLIDSLYNEVLIRDPYAHFRSMHCTYPEWVADIDDPVLAGAVYSDGWCHKQAAGKWGEALAKRPKLLGLRINRARSFYYISQYDSTVRELGIVVDTLRTRDQKKLVFFYNTKEMLEYMTGIAHARMRNYPAAREAYGRALSENLSFYMAHARLGDVALAQGDLETAVNEYDLAVQLKGDDAALRYNYGTMLLQAKRYADAEAQYRKSLEMEPYHALAYFDLGTALEAQGKKAEALEQYKIFLARVPKARLKLTNEAKKRVAALSTTVALP